MDAFKKLKGKLKVDHRHRVLFGAIPMIITPRWFFVNVQKELEKAGGIKLAKEVYYRAGFESAYKYCRTQRKAEKITGIATVQNYLGSMSIRGWGKFRIVQLDERKGRGVFRLYRSAFGEEYGPTGRAVCHCWPGAMAGAVQELVDARGLSLEVKGKELKCKAKGDEYCEFVVAPIRKSVP
jgi:predicted hydrocarbon binding protein